VDADAGENGHVVYALEPDSTRSSRVFRIDPATGSVLLVDLLPVNDVNTTYDVTVVARDAGLPVKSAALRLTIMVCNVTWSLCVCVLVTTVNCAKMDERIEMMFGVLTRASPRNHVHIFRLYRLLYVI